MVIMATLPALKKTGSSRNGSPEFHGSMDNTEGDVSRELSVLKHRKKQAANDAQLLLNRIALLQKEEERARRKIEQTKDRASDILSMRDENYKRVERFVRSAEEEAALQNSLHEKNLQMDQQARETRLNQIHKVLSQRQEAVRNMRQQKKEHEKVLLSNYEKELAAKQKKRDLVKQKEEIARMKKIALREAKEKKKHEMFLKKAAEEEREARKAEQFVQMLEQKEKEWFSRLQNTQEVQENAYVYLENALMQDAPRPSSKQSNGGSPLQTKVHHSMSLRTLSKVNTTR